MLRRILIIFGYIVLAIVLVGLTFALVAYGNDYSYDFATHRIIQNGHVILQSLPTGLKVTADGRTLSKKTPYQAAYKVGFHTFSLEKDGFWPWKKTLEVVAGQVTLASYVIMMPTNPQRNVLDTRKAVVDQSLSKDHRHLAYISGGEDGALYSLDIGNPKPVKLYQPKAALDAQPAEVLRGVTWSDDASHLLIVSSMGAQTVYRLAAASGGEPVNLTDKYKTDFSGLRFSSSNWRQMYWLAPDGLRRLDEGAGTMSQVLADRVSQFWVTSADRILYVQQTDFGRSLWSLDSHDKHQELIPALAASDAYSVAYAPYRGEDELAVVPLSTGTGTLYSGIFGNTPVSKVVAHGVSGATFSPDGHLVAFSSPGSIFTYDLEQSELHNKLVSYAVEDQPGTLQALSWFDNYHLLTTRAGHIYWSEFDGANRIDLGMGAAGLPAYGTADFKSLIEFRPDGANTRVELAQVR